MSTTLLAPFTITAPGGVRTITPSPAFAALPLAINNLLIGPAGSPALALNADGSIGVGASKSDQTAIAIGQNCVGGGYGNIALGHGTNLYNVYQVAVGHGVESNALVTTTIGYGQTNDTDYRLQLGGCNPLSGPEAWIMVDPAQSGAGTLNLSITRIALNGLLTCDPAPTTPFAPQISSDGSGGLTVGSLIESATLTPTSVGTAGVTGQIAWDSGHIYVCTNGGTAGNATWKAAALTSV